MPNIPTLETKRLRIRPFVMEDLEAVFQLLDVDLDTESPGTDPVASLADRRDWLRWTVLNYEQLASLYQPPYGDRAVVLKAPGALIGACGFVPCLNPFEQLPAFSPSETQESPARATTEFGIFYAIAPSHQRQGYATEAARALIDYAFQHLNLKRVIATTEYDNAGSIGVMRRLGMQLERNPLPEPPWLQVVGMIGTW